jgi:hypothetical protein
METKYNRLADVFETQLKFPIKIPSCALTYHFIETLCAVRTRKWKHYSCPMTIFLRVIHALISGHELDTISSLLAPLDEPVPWSWNLWFMDHLISLFQLEHFWRRMKEVDGSVGPQRWKGWWPALFFTWTDCVGTRWPPALHSTFQPSNLKRECWQLHNCGVCTIM